MLVVLGNGTKSSLSQSNLEGEQLNTDKPLIKEGDLVTITLDEHNMVSNTYVVAKKLEAASVLSHPLAPDCYLLKQDSDLNNAFPSMQSQLEKCLFFARKNQNLLGYTMSADLEALCFYFVVRKAFTPKQRNDLANICGKIASIVLNNNISSAIVTIKQNKVLMDEYNHSLFNGIKKVIDNPLSLKNKGERYTLFNIAGFVLAQLSNA